MGLRHARRATSPRRGWVSRACRRERSRVAALVTLVGLSAALTITAAPPASAVGLVSWNTPASQAKITGTQAIDVTVTSAGILDYGKITKWSIEVLLPNETHATAARVLCSRDYGPNPTNQPRKVDVLFTWDTTRVPPLSEQAGATQCAGLGNVLPSTSNVETSANGGYRLRVRVTTNEVAGPHTNASDLSVTLDNPPSAPSGVGATFNAAAQQMTVGWAMALEPDVTGYSVDQCRKDSATQACTTSDWVRIANPTPRTTVSLTQAVADPGAYTYRAGARRPGVSGDLVSTWSTPSTPVVLAPGGGDGDGGGNADDDGDGSGGGSTSPSPGESGGTPTGAAPEQTKAGTKPGGSGSGGDRQRGGLPPRVFDRAEVDAGYEEALPYGAKPLDELSGRDGLAEAARGLGLALVPVAGGLVLFVFSMQMRYLSRRADDMALATAGAEVSLEPTAPGLSDLGAGGSFISNWKRLLDP